MKPIHFSTTTTPNLLRLHALLNKNTSHPHIHLIDMPYRLTSTWQDEGCEIGLWEQGDQLLAWAVYLPAWWNVDYAIHPDVWGSALEKDVLAWAKEQMIDYGKRTNETFYGSIEFFADAPKEKKTIEHLASLGYTKFEWSILRFEIDIQQQVLPEPQVPDGFTIRPLKGVAEVEAYVNAHRAAFGSDKMTVAWRRRSLQHPAYQPEIDLIAVDTSGNPAGFCVCWQWENTGQIEPLGVHPDYQRLGLGRALELTALQIFRQRGVHSVQVDHTSFNEKAISLSLQTGFKQINDALRYFIDVNNESESTT
ncbi:MAG: N-acetyltransferase [Chloroflexota bacterium]